MAISQNFPSTRPSLNLNFARSKKLDPRITFTRTSSATYVGEDGLIKIAPANEARFDHDPITGESLGLLVEESRTNLLLRSEEFDNAYWNKANSSINSNTNLFVAPDGSFTVDKLVENNLNTFHLCQRLDIPFTNAVTYTATVFAKSAERNILQIAFGSAAFGLENYVNFNLTSGIIGLKGTDLTASISSFGNGWYRCSATATATATVNSLLGFLMQPNNNSGRFFGYQGDGTSGIYVWGAQLEQGAFPTSYIPTTASTATRTADNASMTGSNFSSWYRQDEGTFISNSSILKSGIQTQFVWNVGDGTNQISLRSPQVTGDRFRGNIGNVFTPTPGTGNTLVTTSKAAIAYNSALGRLQVGNSSDEVVPSQLPTLTSSNVFAIGNSGAGGNSLNGTIRQITYYPSRLTNTQLITLTK
jgi:hypothetical protein